MSRAADETCWTMIRGAAAGRAEDREAFARCYEPIVRAYLGARWRDGFHAADLDDAVQEVFLQCFREGGVLERVESSRPGGFRAFLFGVVRNVALKLEEKRRRRRERQPPAAFDLGNVAAEEASLSRIFDRAWSLSTLEEAARLQEERARLSGDDAVRRVELLHLRFQEDLPVREIARRWNVDADRVHREYARARREFRAALMDVVAFHHPGTAAEVAKECEDLLGFVRHEP